MPEIAVGTAVTVSADSVGDRPKWLRWTADGTAAGNAQYPSGHRRLVKQSGGIRSEADYFIIPPTPGATDAQWRATIYAPNGSHIFADGLRGFATIGTPTVRLQTDAPAKAVLTIPAKRSGGILAPSFDGWSDGHAEAVGRGMEVTVEYRNPDNDMALVFRGQIYQIESGEAITITAYDRLMDLYQYSDQYQATGSLTEETLTKTGDDGTNYTYASQHNIGTVLSGTATNLVEIDPTSELTDSEHPSEQGYWFIQSVPNVSGLTPQQGSRITRIRIKAAQYRGDTSTYETMTLEVGLFRRNSPTSYTKIAGAWGTHTVMSPSQGGTFVQEIPVDWILTDAPSSYYFGVKFSTTGSAAYLFYTRNGNHYTAGTSMVSTDDGATWSTASRFPELAVTFTQEAAVNVSDITASGTSVQVAISGVPVPSGSYINVVSAAQWLRLGYLAVDGTPIASIIDALIRWAGLVPELSGAGDLGITTFYTTSTFDYLTCVQELIKGAHCGARATIERPGEIEIKPKHTLDDAPVASFTTAPDGAGERAITSHNLTAHWMAEKATQAIIAENATSSGLPIALETDDKLMAGSIAEALQSPLRGITADNTMGTHALLASSAAGKIVQLHTNVFEGDLTLAGYRTEIWALSGSYTGGNPLAIDVPEYGAQGVAIPTEVEFSGGVTKVSLNNIRTADRSELARSMGLTADALSNTSQALPSTTYIFGRLDDYTAQDEGYSAYLGGIGSRMDLLDASGNVLATAVTDSNTKHVIALEDSAGYWHICGIFDPDTESGIASTAPIAAVRFGNWIFTWGWNRYIPLDNPKYALAGQAVHVDIRYRLKQ